MENNENMAVDIIGAIIGLARAVEGNKNRPSATTHNAILFAMYCVLPGMAVDERQIEEQLLTLHREKERLVPRCFTCTKACGRNDDFDLYTIGELAPDLLAAKDALLFGLLALEPLMRNPTQNGVYHDTIDFIYKGFFFVGYDCGKEETYLVLTELEKVRMRLLQGKLWMDE